MKNFSKFIPIVLCLASQFHLQAQQAQVHVEQAPVDGVYVQNPARDGIIIDSAMIGLILRKSNVGIAVLETNKDAIYLDKPGQNGITIRNTGHDGINIDSTNRNGLRLKKISEHGLYLSQIDSNGLHMTKVKKNGIFIDQAPRGIDIKGVNEGIRMRNVGGIGVTIQNPVSHGVEIVGAGIHGLKVRNTEANGVDVFGAGTHGIRIEESTVDGLHIENSGGNGLDIFDSEGTGIKVTESGGHGASINNAAQTGMIINATGSHGIHINKAGTQGIQIDSAASDGIVIDAPGTDGIHIKKAGTHGIQIDNPSSDGIVIDVPGDDGINIISPTDDGITILQSGNDGIHVNGANRHAGIFINDMGSLYSSVLISHGDDNKQDLQLAGNGLIMADENFTFQLDGSDAIANATFRIRNSAGHIPLIVTEDGDLGITGHLSKGSGSFKIDHPLDPQNKYLYHSFVESPDMMNIYNGNAILDKNGHAKIDMPDWFDALNRDFRYQLTAIGQSADLYIAGEMQDRSFRIAGGKPGMKVSWQVTGIRQDQFANANRIKVEVEKEKEKKGTYLHPELWPSNSSRLSAENGVNVAPEYHNYSKNQSNNE